MASDVSLMGQWWSRKVTVPQPDSREGAALAVAAAFSLVYIVVLVAVYGPMTRIAFEVTSLSLLISLVAAFSLSSMMGSDIAAYQRFELELARTVLAYVGSGSPPSSDAPLAGVWRAHIAAAEESRRMARAHGYALGLFTGAGVISLGATLLAGLGVVTATQNVIGVGMFLEWFAFAFLTAGAVAVAVSVGYASSEELYELFAPRRWRRNSGRQQAVEGAVSEIGWLAEFARGAREARPSPSGRSVVPGWQE